MSPDPRNGHPRMRLGVHVSIAGSFSEAPRRAAELGCDCFQIFAGPPRNWRRRVPGRAEAGRFRSLVGEHGLGPVAVHAGYLVHLASERRRVARASRSLLRKEIAIASRLGADYYVIHPGALGGRRRGAVLERFAETVTDAMSERDGASPDVLVENTASARTGLCARFEHLGEMLALLGSRLRAAVSGPTKTKDMRFGVCFDTAHATAAGYDLATPEGAARTLRALFKTVGRGRVKLVHANDSRSPVGSNRDLHEHIGRGHVGRKGFRELFSDGTMRQIPAILETPVDRPGDDRRNLAALRRIAREAERRRG